MPLARCAEGWQIPSAHSRASCSQRREGARCQTITTVYLAALTDGGASRENYEIHKQRSIYIPAIAPLIPRMEGEASPGLWRLS